MIRISTAQSFTNGVSNLQRKQIDLYETNDQLTSGLRVRKASDDPTAAAQAERARALLQRTEAAKTATDASRVSMQLSESALGNAGDLLQEARELVMGAGNGSYSDAERKDLASRIKGIRDQLLGVANRSNGAAGYVFAGQGASQPPFLDGPGGVRYVGLTGQVQVASDEPLPLTLDGAGIWLAARGGNGVFETRANSSGAWIDAGRVTNPAAVTGDSYQIKFNAGGTYDILKNGNPTAVTNATFASGQAIEVDGLAVTITGSPAAGDTFDMTPAQPDTSVFDALDQIVADLSTPGRSGAQVTQAVQSGLAAIDAVAGHMQSARAMTGEVLVRIDHIQSRNDDMTLFAQSTRSAAEDLDLVKGLSDFQAQQIGTQAAMQSYARIQRMTLMDYLR